jgi:putative ABC transport system permease protein
LFRDLVAPARAHGRWPYRAGSTAAFAAIAVLAVALSPYRLFTLEFLGGAAAALLLLRGAAAVLSRALLRLRPRKNQVVRLALANLTRPGAPVSAIIVALGLGLTLLATVVLIEISIDADVQDQLPAQAPSFFFIDIQQNEIGPLTALIGSFPSARDFTATPMLRGRIVKLNGAPADPAKVAADARWALNGDRGVTYASAPPKDARVVAGPAWWPADYRGPSLVSFDADLARGMGLKLGDTITVNLLGRDIDLKIYNLRAVAYRTGGINFAMVASPGVIDRAPHSYVATVRTQAADEDALFAAISQKFPNVTVVRVKEALAQVGDLLAALAKGVEAASLVTILAGILVLAGAIAAGHQARLYDAVVLKVLGATRGRIAAIYAVEYGVLGALAGLAALAAGTLAAWGVSVFVLDIPFVFAGTALAVTILGGAAATLLLGLAGGFAALSAKPARRLRSS